MALPARIVMKALPLALGFGAMIAGQILLVRGAGADLFGRFSLVVAWVNFAAVVAVAGFPFSATKVLPRLLVVGAAAAVRQAVTEMFLSVGGLSVLVAVLLGVAVVLDPFAAAPASLKHALAALLLIPLVGLSQLRVSVSSALGRLWVGQLPDTIIRPLLLGGAVLCASRWYANFGLRDLVSLTVGIYGLTAIVGGLLLWRALPQGEGVAVDALGVRADIRKVAIYMGATNVVISVMKSIDVIVVGSIVPPDQLAAYVVVTRLGEAVNTVYFFLDPVYLPQFAVLIHLERRDALARSVGAYRRMAAWWSLVCFAMFGLFGGLLLGLFGRQYAGASAVLLGLVGGLSVNALTGPGGQLLTIGGLEHANFYTTIASVACYLMLIVPLAARYGIGGAVLTLAVYQLLRGALQAFVVKRRLGIGITVFGGRFATL